MLRNARISSAIGALCAALVLGAPTHARSQSAEAPPAPVPSAQARLEALDLAPIREAVRALADDVGRLGGTAGVAIVDVRTGDVVAAVGEHTPFNPASNAKLVTAATALRRLGPQHRFQTGIYGIITKNSVDELVLRGDGDPSLRTQDLWAMAGELRAMGVRKVRSIAVDQSFFEDRYVPPAFEQQPNEWAPFRAPVAPVSLDENTVLFSIRPTKEGHDAWVDVEPPGFVDATGNVKTSRVNDPEKVQISVEAKGARLAARLGGTIPEGARLVRVSKRVDDPRLLAGYALRAVLKQVGVEVSGEVQLGGQREKALLVSRRSASVGELLWALGKDSDNFYAEMLFKAIGAAAHGRPASADAAAQAAVAELKALGAFEAGVVVKNGSGLFDANRITPWASTALLRAMARDAASGPEFLAQLSIGGVDGTLRHRFRGWAPERAIRAKTGTLDAVAALSGYVLPPAGQSALAFSVLVNGIPGKVGPTRPAMDRVVEACAKELWRGVK